MNVLIFNTYINKTKGLPIRLQLSKLEFILIIAITIKPHSTWWQVSFLLSNSKVNHSLPFLVFYYKAITQWQMSLKSTKKNILKKKSTDFFFFLKAKCCFIYIDSLASLKLLFLGSQIFQNPWKSGAEIHQPSI